MLSATSIGAAHAGAACIHRQRLVTGCITTTSDLIFFYQSPVVTTAGTIRRLYLQHLIAMTPQNKLRTVLAPLATPDVKKQLNINMDYLLDHPDEIVPFFTSKAADDVLLAIGSMLAQNGEKVDVGHFTSGQQQQLKTAMDNGQLKDWVAKKYRKGRSDPDEVGLRKCYSRCRATA